MSDIDNWRELGQQLRVDSIRAANVTKSGHPTSSMSAADLTAVLLSKYLHYDFDQPENPNNDHLIFSKGHASPLLYSLYKAAGAITDDELLTFRVFGSRMEGHPTPEIPWVDVATGSLGQGLPIGVGMALNGKCLDRLPYRVWVLLGDSELAEGSVWEAIAEPSLSGLDNAIWIIDYNRQSLDGVVPEIRTPRLEAMFRAADSGDLHEQVQHDVNFHRLIVEASGNETLIGVWRQLRVEARTFITALTTEIDLHRLAEMHRPVLEALAERDPDKAGRALRTHVAGEHAVHVPQILLPAPLQVAVRQRPERRALKTGRAGEEEKRHHRRHDEPRRAQKGARKDSIAHERPPLR